MCLVNERLLLMFCIFMLFCSGITVYLDPTGQHVTHMVGGLGGGKQPSGGMINCHTWKVSKETLLSGALVCFTLEIQCWSSFHEPTNDDTSKQFQPLKVNRLVGGDCSSGYCNKSERYIQVIYRKILKMCRVSVMQIFEYFLLFQSFEAHWRLIFADAP